MELISYTGHCLRNPVINERVEKRLAWRTLIFVISEYGLRAHSCQALLIARVGFPPIALFVAQADARQFSIPPRKDHSRTRESQKLTQPLKTSSGIRGMYKHETTPHVGNRATARTNLSSSFNALQDWLGIRVI
jgi:hypothetical protein